MNKYLSVIPLVLLLCFGCKKADETAPQLVQADVMSQSGYAEVNGTKLYYEIAGSGDSLVLIHGNGGDLRHWDDQFGEFSRHLQVIRYDVRGFGKSALPVEGEGYRHVDDLKALLVSLGIEKAHICGLSMGSGIAVDFVLAYPEMCSSLISVGPWVNGYESPSVNEIFQVFGEVSAVAREKGPKAAVDAWLNTSVFKNTYQNPEVFARMAEIGYDYSCWHFINTDPVQNLSPLAIQQIEEINLPTLIVTAENDIEACKEIADLLDQTLPNSRKIEIASAGHVVNMEKPDEFNAAVLSFISSLSR